MNRTTLLLCAHSGLLFAALMGLGIFGFAGWLPPVAPSLAAADVAAMFHENHTRIRIGMSILAAASVLFWPFSAAISSQMKRIEGFQQHPLASVQLACSTGTVVAVLLPAYLWLALSFRDTTSPETLQLINDFCGFSFVGMYPPAVIQSVVIGFCILSDRNERKVYPRWLAYVNFWFAAGFVPGVFVPFFKTGAFAWNGIIAFWLVAALFFGWIVLMWWATVRGIQQQPAAA